MKTRKFAHPRVSASAMAALLDRSEERLRQLVRAGTLPSPEGGKYAPVETLQAWAKYLEARLAEKHDGGKERMATARAALLEHRLEVERGRFIPEDEVKRDVTRGFTELKTQLLVIPRQLEMACGREVSERVEREVMAVLDLMASGQWAADLKQDSKK